MPRLRARKPFTIVQCPGLKQSHYYLINQHRFVRHVLFVFLEAFRGEVFTLFYVKLMGRLGFIPLPPHPDTPQRGTGTIIDFTPEKVTTQEWAYPFGIGILVLTLEKLNIVLPGCPDSTPNSHFHFIEGNSCPKNSVVVYGYDLPHFLRS